MEQTIGINMTIYKKKMEGHVHFSISIITMEPTAIHPPVNGVIVH